MNAFNFYHRALHKVMSETTVCPQRTALVRHPLMVEIMPTMTKKGRLLSRRATQLVEFP